jgi:hypothetical protein
LILERVATGHQFIFASVDDVDKCKAAADQIMTAASETVGADIILLEELKKKSKSKALIEKIAKKREEDGKTPSYRKWLEKLLDTRGYEGYSELEEEAQKHEDAIQSKEAELVLIKERLDRASKVSTSLECLAKQFRDGLEEATAEEKLAADATLAEEIQALSTDDASSHLLNPELAGIKAVCDGIERLKSKLDNEEEIDRDAIQHQKSLKMGVAGEFDWRLAHSTDVFVGLCEILDQQHGHWLGEPILQKIKSATRLFKQQCMSKQCAAFESLWSGSFRFFVDFETDGGSVLRDEDDNTLEIHAQTLGSCIDQLEKIESNFPSLMRFFSKNEEGTSTPWLSELEHYFLTLEIRVQELGLSVSIKPLCRYYTATKALATLDERFQPKVGRIQFSAIRRDIFKALCLIVEREPLMLLHPPEEFDDEDKDERFLEFAFGYFNSGNASIDGKFKTHIQTYRKCLRGRVRYIENKISDIVEIEDSPHLNIGHVHASRALAPLILQLKWVHSKTFPDGEYTAMLAELGFDDLDEEIRSMIARLERFLVTRKFRDLAETYQFSKSIEQYQWLRKIEKVSGCLFDRVIFEQALMKVDNDLRKKIEADLRYFESHNLQDFECKFAHDSQVGHCMKGVPPVAPKELHAALMMALVADSWFKQFVCAALSHLDNIIKGKLGALISCVKEATNERDFTEKYRVLQRTKSLIPEHLCVDTEWDQFDQRAIFFQRRMSDETSRATVGALALASPRTSAIVAKIERLCEHSQERVLRAVDAIIECVQSNDECSGRSCAMPSAVVPTSSPSMDQSTKPPSSEGIAPLPLSVSPALGDDADEKNGKAGNETTASSGIAPLSPSVSPPIEAVAEAEAERAAREEIEELIKELDTLEVLEGAAHEEAERRSSMEQDAPPPGIPAIEPPGETEEEQLERIALKGLKRLKDKGAFDYNEEVETATDVGADVAEDNGSPTTMVPQPTIQQDDRAVGELAAVMFLGIAADSTGAGAGVSAPASTTSLERGDLGGGDDEGDTFMSADEEDH